MNELWKSLALSCIVALLLISCTEGGPEETVEKMRAEACAGNVEGFMSYVDTEAVERNERKREIENALAQMGEPESLKMKIIQFISAKMYEYQFYPFGPETEKELERIDDLLHGKIWDYVETDIKKGKSSEFCTFQVISSDERRDETKLKFASNKEISIWKFDKNFKYQWKLVSIITEPVPSKSTEHDGVSLPDKSDEYVKDPHTHSMQDRENYDFRKVRWGMSKDEVKKNETAEFIGETDNALLYKENIAGLDSKLVYMFEDEKLRNSAYKFENEYSDVEDYINDYTKLKDAYTKKYGEPYTDEVKWTNDTFKDVPSMHEQALIEGHVSYVTQWSLPETNIILNLHKDKDKDEISLMTMYRGFKITNENTETLDIESGEIEEKL